MDLSIIIVNWNSKEYLRKCIGSVFASTRGIEYEIVVIDSGSFDGSDEMLKEHYPQARFIQSEENIGFAKANNVAFKVSKGRNILFLNPDTEVVGSAINALLHQLISLPNVGIVGAKLLNADRSIQMSCIQAFPTILNQFLDSELLRGWRPKSPLWGNAAIFNAQTGPQEVDAISGACMMLKRSVFEQVGLFSEDYFMFTEDIDLSFKVHQAGYRNFYVPDATIIHYGGGSSGSAPGNFSVVMTQESIWKYFRKTRGKLYGSCYRIVMLFSSFCRMTALAMVLPIAYARNCHVAWKDSFRKWRAIFRWCLHQEAWVKKYDNRDSSDAAFIHSSVVK